MRECEDGRGRTKVRAEVGGGKGGIMEHVSDEIVSYLLYMAKPTRIDVVLRMVD